MSFSKAGAAESVDFEGTQMQKSGLEPILSTNVRLTEVVCLKVRIPEGPREKEGLEGVEMNGGMITMRKEVVARTREQMY